MPEPSPSAPKAAWPDSTQQCLCGPSGTGQSHLLEALGHAAIDAGHHVSWFSLEALGTLVRRHRADDSITRAIRRIMRAEVIVIDDIGLLPVTTETAEALYRVVDAAYEKRAIALSSNLHPAGFDELMPKTIANATVDRLMHHAHLVVTTGDSIRLTQATTGKGVNHCRLNPRQNSWPRLGSSVGHQQAGPTAITGQHSLTVDSMTHAAISEQLGIPLGTVKSRSHRAHRKLATQLGHLRSLHD